MAELRWVKGKHEALAGRSNQRWILKPTKDNPGKDNYIQEV